LNVEIVRKKVDYCSFFVPNWGTEFHGTLRQWWFQMASLPYITSPGNIDKALNGIKNAAVPERVSQDFVKTILKIPGGSGAQMTSFLKKLGLTNNDGSPNDLYRKFRNPTSSGMAIAAALKSAYSALYVRNEFVHELGDNELVGLIVEETGDAHDSNSVKLIASCIKHLKSFASFTGTPEPQPLSVVRLPEPPTGEPVVPHPPSSEKRVGFNLGYTINLNLPATADAAVFDAIFKSLKTHLLREDDA
jgi:hypothetical protein